MMYKLIASGGTFDHFHKGHREFIKKQLELSEKVLIGLTTDSFARGKKENDSIQEYGVRKNVLEQFINQQKAGDRVEIEPIDNIYIPQKWNQSPIEAIVVTKETKTGAELINKRRHEDSLSQLDIVVFNHVLAEDGIPISSYRIRNGEINREGRLFVKLEWFSHDLLLPEKIRNLLKKPFDKIITGNPFEKEIVSPSRVITVGDVTTQLANTAGFTNRISIIDFLVEREKKFTSIKEVGFNGKEKVFHAVNPRGTITFDMLLKTKEAIFEKNAERIILIVDGEEDLAVLPCLLLSPLGVVIFYGQPKVGTVRLVVTEEIKEHAYLIVSKFT